MVPDRVSELLSAYVDGQLSQRQRRAVLRLLRRSPEAQAYLRQLEQDADALRRLPRKRLDPAFATRVLQALRDRHLEHPRRLVLAPPSSRPAPPWLGLAMAASILLLIGAGSFVYFTHTAPEQVADVAVAVDRPRDPDQALPPDTRPADPKPSEPTPPPPQPATAPKPAELPKPPKPAPVVKAPKEARPPVKPAPEDASVETTLTVPVPEKEMFQPRSVEASLPLILKFAELEPTKLREELKKDSGFRLEVPCRESTKAFERLQTAFRANGVTLVIDQAAHQRLRQPSLKTNFVIYAEDLLPEELTRILKRAANEDHKAEAKHRGDGELDGLVVTHMNKDDQKELATLLGVDRSARKSPAEVLAPGQGGTPRPDANKAAAKPPERQALVLAYNPVRPRPNSAEVKRFLEGLKPARGGIDVLLVLRETKR